MKSLTLFKQLAAILVLLALSGGSRADFHLWFITELYSNADGTVQFIELKAYASGQQFIAGHTITSSQGSTVRSYTFPSNLPGNTATTEPGDPYYGGGGMTTYKSFLIGTQGFAALGVVTPDYIVPNGFLFTANGRVNFAEGADVLNYASLPTDGSLSLKRDGSTSMNSPLNFAEQSGTVSLAGAPASYQGLWLRTPFDSEAGWGLNLTHQGNTLFGTWFTYDTDGTGMWLVMSNGALVSAGRYEGTLYRTTGPGFNATPFTSINTSNYTVVGSLILTFNDANSGTMTYTVNGISQSKPIGRYIYASGGTSCTLGGSQGASPNYQDLWWRSPADTESGWGLNITHQGDTLFATWFTYEAGGTAAAPAKGMWLVMSNGNRTGPGVYTGTLYRTIGPAFSAVPFTPIGQSNYTIVGSMTVTFTDANNGTFMYTVNGITQTRPITRLIYASPTTVCR